MREYIIELSDTAVSGGYFLLGTCYLEAHELVRCRDCKHKHEMANGRLACAFRPLMMHETTADAFCSDGERVSE